MPTQLALAFDAVPGTCEVQERYHSIAPCLADVRAPAEQAQALNLGYSTITRWLRDFREEGLPGFFPQRITRANPTSPSASSCSCSISNAARQKQATAN